MYSRILNLGEYVRIGESEGTVTHINMLTTRLRSVYGEELVLPNTVVMAQTTINYSRLRSTGGGQMTTDVTIGYDAPWRQVHAMLLRAAERTPGLLRDPPPTVLQTELADFYVRYRLTVTVDVPADRIPVLSVLHKNIQDDFNEHGVQIMSPHFMANPPHPVVVPKERWNAAPADPAAG
jgi:small-conductance mechanosensitive channel